MVSARKGVNMEDVGGRLEARPWGNLKVTGAMNWATGNNRAGE